MKGIVDRLEEKIAVIELESGDMLELSIEGLALNEGDVVYIDGEDITVDVEATQSRKKEIDSLFDSLLE